MQKKLREISLLDILYKKPLYYFCHNFIFIFHFSGILLTLAIALFHGKCYILRRTELLHGYRIPHKKIINESRTYSFGWSFYLAWICVFLCFVSSFVWLYKAQDPKQSRIPGVNYIRHRYRRGRYSFFED